jgi:hypothetical protein
LCIIAITAITVFTIFIIIIIIININIIHKNCIQSGMEAILLASATQQPLFQCRPQTSSGSQTSSFYGLLENVFVPCCQCTASLQVSHFFRYLGTLSRLVFCSQSFVLRSSSFQFSKLFQRIAKLLRTMQITSFYTMSSASTQRTSLNQTALGAGCRSLH